MEGVRQDRDADEHHNRQGRHRDQRRRRVLRLRRTERRHAVRHRLDAGHRRAAVRERRQQQEQRERLVRGHDGIGRRHRMNAAAHDAKRADADEDQRADDEEIGRDGENLPRLADASQVAEHQQHDERERQLHAVHVPLRKRRRDRGDARGDAHRDGQDVIDQQRRGSDTARS